MKGILLEKDKKIGLFITDAGEFVKGYHDNRDIGEVLEIRKIKASYYKFVSAAIIIFALITCCLPFNAFSEPYGYAAIDINPSIELAYNESLKVIKISSLNEDGKVLIDKLNIRIKGMPLNDAIEEIISLASVLEYSTENVVLTFTKVNSENSIESDNNTEEILNEIKSHNENITIIDVDKEIYKELKENSQPPAVNVIKSKLAEMNVDEEEYRDVEKVSDLAHIMVKAKKAEQEAKKEERMKSSEEEKEIDIKEENNSEENGNKNKDNNGNSSDKSNRSNGEKDNNGKESGRNN
jgi:hypothetical protein